MLGVRSYEPAMNRLPMPHKRPKYRRPTTTPAMLPLPPVYRRYFAQYLAETPEAPTVQLRHDPPATSLRRARGSGGVGVM